MKRYIRSSKYVAKTPYLGYCFYIATNETWGHDALKLLHALGGKRGYVKLPNNRGSYFKPSLVYMFTNEPMYDDFMQELKSHDLLGLVNLQSYQELPSDAIILEED